MNVMIIVVLIVYLLFSDMFSPENKVTQTFN